MRTYDWNGNKNMPITRPDIDDALVAGKVRMLMRSDFDHEPIVCMARDRIMCLSKEKEKLEKEVAALKELAVNFITHSEAVRQIQYKCFANEYPTVPDVGMSIPTYQTTRLQNKLKKISRVTDADLCKRGLDILMRELEQGE